jgi:hypothetical protein
LLNGHRGHILVGPWLGEVGWEVLYWLPLLRWAVHRWADLHDRLVVVSRGGVSGWYEGIAGHYVDLLEAYDHSTFSALLEGERDARRARGENRLKQVGGATPWELEIAEWVGARFGESALPLLHPSLLYTNTAAKKLVSALASAGDEAGFTRWRPPTRGELDQVLPEKYVAVRFYDSSMMRDPTATHDAASFAMQATRALAARVPVVALNPGMETDPQHPDFDVDADVIQLATHTSFENNLEMQSRVIANAKAFVGTFGGLAFLAPHYGVRSLCFWTATHRGVPESKKGPWRDLDIAMRAFNRPGWGGFVARRYDAAPLDELLAPAFR